MTTRDFKVFLEPDEDYGGYVVVCPSIPGCYSQGKTVPEALANIREAIDLCLEDMESRGEEKPSARRAVTSACAIPPTLAASPSRFPFTLKLPSAPFAAFSATLQSPWTNSSPHASGF